MLDSLLRAETTQVPNIVADMPPYRRWLNPLLHEAQTQAVKDNEPSKQLHASLALLPVDGTQVAYLKDRLLDAEPHEVPVICDALAPHKDELLDALWAAVEKPEKGKESQRLRVAAGLAKYDPESEKWDKSSKAVVDQLVAELSDPSPVSAGCRRRGDPQASGRGTGRNDTPSVAPEFGGI